MAAGRLVLPAYMPALDSDGEPISGALIYTYANNTTTPKATYTDAGLSVPSTNPVVADASGVFPSIFADDAVLYSVTVADAFGAPLASYDNVRSSSLLSGANQATPEDFGAVGDGVTDDSAALIAWLAYLAGNDLIGYATRNYKAASNVTSLLASRCPEGPGGIVTSAGRTFHFTPSTSADVNILYVSAAGSSTKDGLTTSTATDFATAYAWLKRLSGRALDGRWQIQFLTGTWTGGYALYDLPYFTNYLEIYGNERNIPAWTTGESVSQFALRSTNSGARVYQAMTSGTCGATAPSGRGTASSADVSDGTVIWRWIAGDPTWTAGESVTADSTFRKSGSYVYMAKTTGITGATAPTHTSGVASDGTVSWQFIGLALTPPSKEPLTVFDGSLNPNVWAAGQSIDYCDARYYGANVYRAESKGTSGATPPTHTSGTASDGTITWRYVGARDTSKAVTALDINPAPRVAVIGMAFRNYDNDALTDDATGFRFQGAETFLMQRCVNNNNNNGAVFVNGAKGSVENTIFNACDHGADFRYHTDINIGGNSAATACFVTNCDTGLYIARESVMHTDYTQFDLNSTGIVHQIMSRSRSSGSHFLRCTRGIWNIDSSQWEDTPGASTGAAFYFGTPFANTTAAVSSDGYSRTRHHREGTQATLRYDKDFSSVTLNGTAALQTVKTLSKTLPGDWFNDNDKELKVVVRGTKTGTVGTYDLRVSLDGSIISGPAGVTAAQAGDFELVLDCVATGNATQVASYEHKINGQTYRRLNDAARAITMIDGNGVIYNRAIQVQVAVAGAGDSVTITSVRAYITG